MIWAATGAMTTVTITAIGLMSFWVARSLDALGGRLDRMENRFDRIDERFDRIESDVLRDHAQRITRLEAHGDT